MAISNLHLTNAGKKADYMESKIFRRLYYQYILTISLLKQERKKIGWGIFFHLQIVIVEPGKVINVNVI